MKLLPKTTRHSSLFFLCFIAWVFLFIEKPAANAYDDAKGFNAAAAYLSKGMYLEALGMYQEIAGYSNSFNNRARALLFMGTTFSLYLDQYAAALKQFELVRTNYPDSPAASDALFNSGMVLYEQGKFKGAYDLFTRYLAQYPGAMRGPSAQIWADSARKQMAAEKTLPPHTLYIPDTTMRILIKEKTGALTVNSGGNITVSDTSLGKKVFHGPGPAAFTKLGRHLLINGRSIDTDRCSVTSDSLTIALDRRRFRGSFTIFADQNGLCAVNHVPVEQYLYGVVPEEMPDIWEKEALMAQAVAARTYALYIKGKSAHQPYDMEATAFSQVYGGYDAETESTNSAVDATRGQVMLHDGKLIIAYFHSNSGGHTEDAKNVWGADIPYLKGVPDPFSDNIPEDAWEHYLSYASVHDFLGRYGLDGKPISIVSAAGRSQSGRILKVRVVSGNRPFELTGNNFRIKVNGTGIKSTLFTITPKNGGILVKGKGHGHGVGMSQWGARRMAQAGYLYPDILKHYYRNVSLVSIGD